MEVKELENSNEISAQFLLYQILYLTLTAKIKVTDK